MDTNYESMFWKMGHEITGHKLAHSIKLGMRKFKAFFGVSPKICELVWDQIQNKLENDSHPKHLLWALLFLKQYNTETTNSVLIKADEKTIRKYIWNFIHLISELQVVTKFFYQI